MFPTKALGRGNPPPALRGFVGNKFERKKVNEEENIFPCVGLGDVHGTVGFSFCDGGQDTRAERFL